jgi:hypothetical protein
MRELDFGRSLKFKYKKTPMHLHRGYLFEVWRCPTLLRASCPPPFGPH